MATPDDTKTGLYKIQNQEFLETYKKGPGTKVLFNGVMVRELKKGSGPRPTTGSYVTVYYSGRLISGKKFDSTKPKQPATFKLASLIVGWKTALKEMPVGARWEIVIPYHLGYGTKAVGSIKPYSTLIFEVELLHIG